ncbi:MAG: ABC transporter ATP-binding protein [Elusimicrobia bacterium]|nr:ABC transporter ATP-binding protein [Candidatus Liberimonas magnetica]
MKESITAISIKNLTVQFGHFKAVDDISFDVLKGEIFGFLGANGAGKTTTIRVLCGLLDPGKGEIRFADKELSNNRMSIKKMVGYMSQKFTLYDDLTVKENIMFKAALRSLSETEAKLKMDELLEFIGFKYDLSTLVRDLPLGVKQQVSLAACLLHGPEVIFLDEPTSGVSPSVRLKFWNLIRELAKNGKTVIVTTHYMDEAENCSRIALMRAGKLIALDSPADLKKTTYPGMLAEVRFLSGRHEAAGVFEELGVSAWWPYGLKYHVVFDSKLHADNFLRALPSTMAGRFISPSLEDVFIRLVEGLNR